MKIMSLMLVLLLAVTALADEPEVIGYLRTSLYVYDEKGNLETSLPAASFNKPLHIVKFDKATNRVGVIYQGTTASYQGKLIFLRNAEVVTKGLAAQCREAIVSAKTATQHLAASDVGAKAGLGSDAVGCIHSPESP